MLIKKGPEAHTKIIKINILKRKHNTVINDEKKN